MNSKRVIDSFRNYYSCCYEAHVLRLEHGVDRFSVQEYKLARDKAKRIREEMKSLSRAMTVLASEAIAEAEKDFHENRG